MKDEQLEVLCHVRNLSDVLVILPTGFGKTLIMMLILAVLNMHSRQGVLILIVPLLGLIQQHIITLTHKQDRLNEYAHMYGDDVVDRALVDFLAMSTVKDSLSLESLLKSETYRIGKNMLTKLFCRSD